MKKLFFYFVMVLALSACKSDEKEDVLKVKENPQKDPKEKAKLSPPQWIQGDWYPKEIPEKWSAFNGDSSKYMAVIKRRYGYITFSTNDFTCSGNHISYPQSVPVKEIDSIIEEYKNNEYIIRHKGHYIPQHIYKFIYNENTLQVHHSCIIDSLGYSCMPFPLACRPLYNPTSFVREESLFNN